MFNYSLNYEVLPYMLFHIFPAFNSFNIQFRGSAPNFSDAFLHESWKMDHQLDNCAYCDAPLATVMLSTVIAKLVVCDTSGHCVTSVRATDHCVTIPEIMAM